MLWLEVAVRSILSFLVLGLVCPSCGPSGTGARCAMALGDGGLHLSARLGMSPAEVASATATACWNGVCKSGMTASSGGTAQLAGAGRWIASVDLDAADTDVELQAGWGFSNGGADVLHDGDRYRLTLTDAQGFTFFRYDKPIGYVDDDTCAGVLRHREVDLGRVQGN